MAQAVVGILRFNPHTHTGCDHLSLVVLSWFYVSIHTPIQGVTIDGKHYCPDCYVSIHTPILGVTRNLWHSEPCRRFQSTHPYRVWRALPADNADYKEVSIHTPIQGVTHHPLIVQVTTEFQSTHPYRVWLFLVTSLYSVPKFQSTHPYRVWRCN